MVPATSPTGCRKVFSKAYQKQFEGDAAARRDAVRESYGVAQENADGSKED